MCVLDEHWRVVKLLHLKMLMVSMLMLLGPTQVKQPLITAVQWTQVLHIHQCEEPTWNVNGPLYYGGLGWLSATWLRFRLPWMPLSMANATPREQAIAMVRFAKVYGWPDQNGTCHGY